MKPPTYRRFFLFLKKRNKHIYDDFTHAVVVDIRMFVVNPFVSIRLHGFHRKVNALVNILAVVSERAKFCDELCRHIVFKRHKFIAHGFVGR